MSSSDFCDDINVEVCSVALVSLSAKFTFGTSFGSEVDRKVIGNWDSESSRVGEIPLFFVRGVVEVSFTVHFDFGELYSVCPAPPP